MRISTRPPRSALLAAIVLTLAVAGSALAGPEGISDKVTKSSAKKIARKQIKRMAPRLAVASADSPFARALVVAEPLTITRNRNIQQSEVDNPRVGEYCFDLSFTPVGAQVTNEIESGSDVVVFSAVLDPLSLVTRGQASRGSAFNGCDPGTDLLVTGVDLTSTKTNSSFFLEVWR